MEQKEFAVIRQYLGKTQRELARILCVSTKAVQSFEEGWRNIPVYAERQLLLLMSLKNVADSDSVPCWEATSCPPDSRGNCIAWELQAGNFCWVINGTFCQGQIQDNWDAKMKVCRECDVFPAMLNT